MYYINSRIVVLRGGEILGRAGRGGGGGSRGSGFGGSRGFGSHSGGSSHRSSWSSHSSSHHSSYHSSYSPRYHHSTGPRLYFFGTSDLFGRPSSGSSFVENGIRQAGMYIVQSILIKAAVFTLIVFALGIYGASSSDDIQKSTIEREKLESTSLVESSEYYEDKLNWIKSGSVLETGMRSFYEKTGVQPFLLITDTVVSEESSDSSNEESEDYANEYYDETLDDEADLFTTDTEESDKRSDFSDKEFEDFANDYYDEKFEDEAHLLVVFFEYNDKYRSCYVTGKEAKTVIDDEAGEILLDYIDHYYYSDMDEDEFFSRSFEDAGTRIMRVTPDYTWIIGLIIVIIILLVIIFKIWKKRKKLKLEEMEKAQKIIDSDLNEFGTAGYTSAGGTASDTASSFDTSEVDELKKKYDGV